MNNATIIPSAEAPFFWEPLNKKKSMIAICDLWDLDLSSPGFSHDFPD